MRYFKKHMGRHADKEDVRLPNGSVCNFTSVDGLTGWFAINNPSVEGGLVQMINEQRGGISEVTAEEFTAGYIEKKKNGQTLRPFWREELGKHVTGNTPLNQLGVEAVQAVAAMGDKPAPMPVIAAEVQPTVPGQAKSQTPYVPRTGRQGKRKNVP